MEELKLTEKQVRKLLYGDRILKEMPTREDYEAGTKEEKNRLDWLAKNPNHKWKS